MIPSCCEVLWFMPATYQAYARQTNGRFIKINNSQVNGCERHEHVMIIRCVFRLWCIMSLCGGEGFGCCSIYLGLSWPAASAPTVKHLLWALRGCCRHWQCHWPSEPHCKEPPGPVTYSESSDDARGRCSRSRGPNRALG